ncbi:MAG: hypothetical protein AB7S48_01180 [Bacteroidales bacterium]
MRRILFTICNLLLVFNLAKGQTLQIRNETKIDFDKVVVFTEREEGRHTYDYNPEFRYGGRKYATPAITVDTFEYASEIKLNKSEKYTLKFVGLSDTVCYAFGISLSTTKQLVLNASNAVFSRKPQEPVKLADGSEIVKIDRTSDQGTIIVDEEGRIDLYFNFINSTPYTIYAIYPWISDEDFRRGTILYHDPDRKLLPNEQRKISVIEDRTMESYSNQTISFAVVAVDSESKLHRFNIKNIELSADNVIIDGKTAE